MLKPRLLGIFLLAAALISTGAGFAVARSAGENDFSVPLEWKNQIIADLEHNKRYLPGTRTRGKSGVVRFEFNMSRSGWVLPGTRIVTIHSELGRAALLLIQQSQPFPPPEHVKLPDASFRVVVPIRFENIPPRDAGLPDAEHRKLLECYEADRQELEYQRRRAAYRNAEPPITVNRMPEGCLEAKQQEEERQRQEAERKEKEARAALEERQRQDARPKGLEYARTSGTTWRITRKKNATTDKVDVTVESVQKNENRAFASVEGVCRNGTIVFFATLVDEAGAASLDFSDRVDGYRGIRTTYRVNDEKPSQKLIPQYQYSNRFFIVAFSAYKERVEWLDLGTHFGVDEFLLLDSPPLDTTWRIIVEINAAQKPIIIKIPVYDDGVQELIQTCK
jgi:TonB family protein